MSNGIDKVDEERLIALRDGEHSLGQLLSHRVGHRLGLCSWQFGRFLGGNSGPAAGLMGLPRVTPKSDKTRFMA